MKNNNAFNQAKLFFSASLLGIIIAAWCCQTIAKPVNAHTAYLAAAKQINAPGLDKNVLNLALKAYHKAKSFGHGTKDYLTVVDYSLPSTTKRMWVIDMQTKTVVHNTLVAHGSGSGDNYARKFSNRPGSGMSSLGLYVTGNMYQGHYGESLKLHGLEHKFNSNALSRGIVVHRAHYVDESIIGKIGRLGRSLGCLALSNKVATKVMHTIKGGSLVFCYYPDQTWLRESTMLQA